MPLTFHPGEIRVFDRGGTPLGVITGWSVEQPRSYRLNEIEDFTFSIPRRDVSTGTVILTTDVNNLLKRDNLIYVANQFYSMRGWAGSIDSVRYANGTAVVGVIGAAGLLRHVDADPIEQTGGYVWTVASRLVAAANAKKAAHGDRVVDFVNHGDASTWRRNLGIFAYEGDVFNGLQRLSSETLCEFFTVARILDSGMLGIELHWGSRFTADHTDIVLSDTGGALAPGTDVSFEAAAVVNRARLRGTPTDMSKYVDYASVRNVIRDVIPECEMVLDSTGSSLRRRESLDLTASFGYSEEDQKALARQVQDRYLGYYKSFLYAYHARLGKPFLDGYDWEGPDGSNDKRLTAHYFRSYSRLAVIKKSLVVVGQTDDDEGDNIEARFDDWQFWQTLNVVGQCVGVATKWTDTETKFVADSTTGYIYELDDDYVTVTPWLLAAGGGETLRSVATDPTQATVVWALVTTATHAIVRSYTTSDGSLITEWRVADPNMNDIAVQSITGVIWTVSTGAGAVTARDINSGAELTTGDWVSFASGMASCVGLSVSGGLAYVVAPDGNIRFLFADDAGNLAGVKATGVPADGLFVDLPGGLVWLVKQNGDINLYRAHIAIDIIGSDGIVEGAPGFAGIKGGQYIHVVMNSDKAAIPHSRKKVVAAYSPGRYVTKSEPGGLGEPDRLVKQWVAGKQKVATLRKADIQWANNECVVAGEESRVDEWNPEEDGYGYFGTATYRTKRGHVLNRGRSWYLHDWDVPDSTFDVEPPEWPDGLAYLQQYLAITNTERPLQTLLVVNVSNLWSKIHLGGKYTVEINEQGPPGGLSGVLRVLSYTPDDRQGYMQVIGEWV